MIQTIAISLIIAGLGLIIQPADNWTILSYPNGTEIQGECIDYYTIEIDGKQWYRLNIDGELYELPTDQVSFVNK